MDIKEVIKKVKQIEIRSRRNTDARLMGEYHTSFKGQGMTFAEVRQYQFGDDIRLIDWNKTAKFKEPYVKVMEEEREMVMMLMVDISASMDYATKTELKREYVAEICATLGFSSVANGDKVGLILFADKVYKVIPPRKGRPHVLSLVSTILKADYISAPTDLDSAFNYLMKTFKRRGLVFLFSDFNDPFDPKNLRVVSSRHQLLGLGIYDEKDQEIPDIGYTLFTDAETGQRAWVNTSSRRWRYNYAEHRRKNKAQTAENFSQSAATFIKLQTKDDYARALYNYFQGR